MRCTGMLHVTARHGPQCYLTSVQAQRTAPLPLPPDSLQYRQTCKRASVPNLTACVWPSTTFQQRPVHSTAALTSPTTLLISRYVY